jgi:hypothetical protein
MTFQTDATLASGNPTGEDLLDLLSDYLNLRTGSIRPKPIENDETFTALLYACFHASDHLDTIRALPDLPDKAQDEIEYNIHVTAFQSLLQSLYSLIDARTARCMAEAVSVVLRAASAMPDQPGA